MVTQKSNVRLVGSAVDWITVTQSDEEQGRWLLTWAQEYVAQAARRGEKVSYHSTQGYNGEKAGGALWGVRRDGVLAQVSGAASDSAWPTLTKFAKNITRIDLAVTVERSTPSTGLVREAYEAPQARRATGRPILRRLLVQGSDGGATAYFGSPAARRRARVYDKGVEAGLAPAGILHRYELQLRREYAAVCARRLSAATDRAGYIQAAVGHYIHSCGVTVPWTVGQHLEARCMDDSQTCDGGRLSWIARSIGPCVEGLCERGHLEQVIAALRLSPYVVPRVSDPPTTQE